MSLNIFVSQRHIQNITNKEHRTGMYADDLHRLECSSYLDAALLLHVCRKNDQQLLSGVYQIWKKKEATADCSKVTAQYGLWNEQWGLTTQ